MESGIDNTKVIEINNFPFSFKGRLERLNYLYIKIGLIIIFILGVFIKASGKALNVDFLYHISYIVSLIFWIGCIFAASKRLRDICWSQWYLLFWFIPLPFVALLADIPLFFIKGKYSNIDI